MGIPFTRTERLYLFETEGGGHPGVVSEGEVRVQRQVHRVEGDIVVEEDSAPARSDRR
jgi:hypothetical protein